MEENSPRGLLVGTTIILVLWCYSKISEPEDQERFEQRFLLTGMIGLILFSHIYLWLKH